MNRKELLEASLVEGQNPTTVVTATLNKDAKFLKKAKRDIEDQIEDAEDALQERLSTVTPLDKSVVEVSFAKIQELKVNLELYKSFEAAFLTETKE